MLELAVVMFCMVGCGCHCHYLGRQEGIETTIEHLINNGMLEIEDE